MKLERPWHRQPLLLLALLLTLCSASLLLLAARGAFVRATGAPAAIGASLTALSLGALLLRRRSAPAVRATLGGMTAILAALAVVAHERSLASADRAIERPAKQALLGRPAPKLQWAHTFNVSPGDSQFPRDDRMLLLDFWATWCSPCRVQMPKLEALYQRGRRLGVDVVGVTTYYGHDSSPDGRRRELQEIADFLEANGITYPVVVADTSSNHDLFHVSALPTSILIGRDGAVIDYGVGLRGAEKVTEHALTAVK